MSSSRRAAAAPSSSSMSRAEQIASGRLRMDRSATHTTRITDPSLPAGRRKEIDNVMKRARGAASPSSWDRKLIEAEEKDPNRWRHTGYKQMYLDGGGGGGGGGSASPPPRRSRSRSPFAGGGGGRRSSPPPLVSTTTAPHGHRRRGASSRERSAVVSSTQRARPESQSVVSSSRDRDRERERDRGSGRAAPAPPARGRPPSPPPPRRGARSPSGSSMSSCTDDSCSVCSVKKHGKRRSRSRSFSVPRSSSSRPLPPAANPPKAPPSAPPVPPHRRLSKPLNSGNANAGPSTLSLRRTASSSANPRINVATTKKSKPPSAVPAPTARPTSNISKDAMAEASLARKRSRDEKVLEWQRTQLNQHKSRKIDKPAPSTPPSPPPAPHKERAPPKLKTRIKKEDERPKKKADDKKSRAESGGDISPEVIAAALVGESSGEEDSSTDDDSYQHHHAETRLTLSERFGKMAQWSADRSNAIQNMRITRGSAGGSLTVRIEENGEIAGDRFEGSPPHRFAHSPAPEGHYPDELLAVAPGGLPSWDDVRVRYDYYKKRGYLRGLTLSDYVKWEEWWYRYQQWLKQERSYERWIRSGGGGGGGGGHRRRRRGHGGGGHNHNHDAGN